MHYLSTNSNKTPISSNSLFLAFSIDFLYSEFPNIEQGNQIGYNIELNGKSINLLSYINEDSYLLIRPSLINNFRFNRLFNDPAYKDSYFKVTNLSIDSFDNTRHIEGTGLFNWEPINLSYLSLPETIIDDILNKSY